MRGEGGGAAEPGRAAASAAGRGGLVRVGRRATARVRAGVLRGGVKDGVEVRVRVTVFRVGVRVTLPHVHEPREARVEGGKP
jgi:hypothetical protein